MEIHAVEFIVWRAAEDSRLCFADFEKVVLSYG